MRAVSITILATLLLAAPAVAAPPADDHVVVQRTGQTVDLGRIDDVAAGQILVTKSVRDGDERIVGGWPIAEILRSPVMAVDYVRQAIDLRLIDRGFQIAVVTPSGVAHLGTAGDILDVLGDIEILAGGRVVARGYLLSRATASCFEGPIPMVKSRWW